MRTFNRNSVGGSLQEEFLHLVRDGAGKFCIYRIVGALGGPADDIRADIDVDLEENPMIR